MNHSSLGWLVAGMVLSAQGAGADEGPKPLAAVPFQHVHLDDVFWRPRIDNNRTGTISACLHQCEITGRLKNFAVTAGLEQGKHEGLLFNDSDVYKVIEGMAYALATRRDPDLERRADQIIDQVAAAQQENGYLNTYFTLVEPANRWKNIQYGHELYCAGHLFEAAVAYHQATGKPELLDVAIRLADHICGVFGAQGRPDACGHEEIELALVKLHRATGDQRYLDLATFFLDVRGRSDKRRLFGEYAQDHKPVRKQTEVAGHAVRAMYLYSAMADVAAATGDQSLLAHTDRIWHDIVDRKMYITGGIGPSASNEGFTVPYDLPNDSAYAETCAAIGMALWNHRLFLLDGDGKYADVLEREVYNGLLSGVSLSGDRFFYTNPLGRKGPLGSKGQPHRVPLVRLRMLSSNIVRYIPGMGERVYATRADSIWTVLYVGGTAEVTLGEGKVRLVQTTNYPWEGVVTMRMELEQPRRFDLCLRIPGWCRSAPAIAVNGQPLHSAAEKGYVAVTRNWQAGDEVRLDLPMPVERVYADPQVKADVGRVALMRGPVVYALESADNAVGVRNLCLPRDAKLESHFEPDLLGGVVVLSGEALRVSRGEDDRLATVPARFAAVPYSTWDNREPGEMVVWLPESPELAEIPGEDGVVSGGIRVRGSHCNPSDTLAALNDAVLPKSSGDHELPRMTWWDHLGTKEWVSYRFPQPRQVSSIAVYWFDDTGSGRCRVPAEWRLLWLDGDEWKPVELAGESEYGAALDGFNRATFKAVTTRELRLEVQLQPEMSGGILEWQVE